MSYKKYFTEEGKNMNPKISCLVEQHKEEFKNFINKDGKNIVTDLIKEERQGNDAYLKHVYSTGLEYGKAIGYDEGFRNGRASVSERFQSTQEALEEDNLIMQHLSNKLRNIKHEYERSLNEHRLKGSARLELNYLQISYRLNQIIEMLDIVEGRKTVVKENVEFKKLTAVPLTDIVKGVEEPAPVKPIVAKANRTNKNTAADVLKETQGKAKKEQTKG